ncbi:MAG: carbohydrate kinase family protein [Deltaproteobacteria bacterium]|nr:carbohydrate kinase family protein [Deltaproteobacteria bacterium]
MTAIGIRAPARGALDVVGIGVNAVDHLCTVEFFPTFDSKQTLAGYDVQPGGQVATALVALQRWGRRCRYVGTFGDGPLGAWSRRSLVDEGIEVAYAPTRGGVANQCAVILVDRASGERTILMHRPVALTLRPEEVDRGVVTGGRVLHLDGYDADAAHVAASWARAAGVPVVVDVDTGVEEVERLLRLTDAVILACEFACALTGAVDAEAALGALAVMTGAPLVAVTLGAGGVIARTAAGTLRVPGFAVRAVDTTGAGDVFRAGFIHGLLADWSLERTLAFANAGAALKCTVAGGRPGIPTVAAAEALVAARGIDA